MTKQRRTAMTKQRKTKMIKSAHRKAVAKYIKAVERNLEFINAWASENDWTWGDGTPFHELSFDEAIRGQMVTIQKITGDLLDRLDMGLNHGGQ